MVPCASRRMFSGRIIATASSPCDSAHVSARSAKEPRPSWRAVAVGVAHRHRHEVRRAQEVGHERGLGRLVERARLVALLDVAAAHDRDAVAHGQRLVLVVGDVDEGDLELLLDALELDLQVDAQARVERAERLVEQQHGRLEHERARQGDALLLAAGELRRAPVPVVLHAHQRQRLGDAALDLGLGGALVAQAEGDVLGHRLVREERVALEDRVDAPLVRRRARHVVAVEQDLALVGRSKPAIRRSVVVLPQPDGPSMVKNSPGGTCRSMPLTATASPKRLTRPTSRMSPSLMRDHPMSIASC